MNEYLISVDNYKKPKVVKGTKAEYYQLLRLMLMDPGTNPLFPLMGLGLYKKVRYISEDDLTDVQEELSKQIETYLPDLGINDVNMELVGKKLNISISSDETSYDFNSDEFDLDFNSLVEESSGD